MAAMSHEAAEDEATPGMPPRPSWERVDPKTLLPDVSFDRRLLADHLRRYAFAAGFSAGKSVLDVACGVGYGSALLMRDGKARSVVGIDVSAEAIETARRDYGLPGITYLRLDVEGDAIPRGPYDLVVSFETIEHLRDPGAFLVRLGECMHADSLLVASCPVSQTTDINRHHLHDFTRKEVLRLFADAGFEVAESHVTPLRFSLLEYLEAREKTPHEPTSRERLWLYYLKHPEKLLVRLGVSAALLGFALASMDVVAKKR